jgi:hypothetical protein
VFFSANSGFDLGFLFHAKEHPEEFTNRTGPALPICSAETGGQSDPRRGTRLSIRDETFLDRNFLWLMSLNASFRFHLSTEQDPGPQPNSDLLAPGASGSRFFTIDESNFGMQLGTICYLPKAHDPAVPHKPCLEPLSDAQQTQPGPGPLGSASARDPSNPSDVQWDVLCIPCHGFQSDWHLARALVNAQTTIHEEAAIQNVHVDAELLALLAAGHDERKRVQRLGNLDRRVRLLALAQREQLAVQISLLYTHIYLWICICICICICIYVYVYVHVYVYVDVYVRVYAYVNLNVYVSVSLL